MIGILNGLYVGVWGRGEGEHLFTDYSQVTLKHTFGSLPCLI